MKKHSGMRPHDILVLLKISSKKDEMWYMKDLAHELGVSASEISESINRSIIAGLLMENKKRLMKQALLDFLEHGLKYVYPQRPGAIVRGIPTAHSGPPLEKEFLSNEKYVMPYSKGHERGQMIEPLHKNAPKACLNDEAFYELVALCDAIRVGRVREKNIAIEKLRERICSKTQKSTE